jgi:hypothetical protein
MGLKIAKFIKKNVNLKTAVKLGGTLVPGVGGSIIQGLQAAAEAKKAAKSQKEQENAIMMAQEVGSQIGNQAGTLAGNVLKGATKSAMSKTSQAFDESTGIVGAKVLDNTIIEWIKSHKAIIIGICGSAILAIFFFRKPKTGYKKKW